MKHSEFEIKKVARGNWRAILEFSTKLNSRKFKNVHQPCPLCRDGKDRYRFDDNKGAGTYFCNCCGAGDGFKFLAEFHKESEEQVIERLVSILGMDGSEPKIKFNESKGYDDLPETTVIVPAPLNVPTPSFYHYKHGKPAKVWKYTDVFGDVFCYICRFNLPDGRKEVVPMTYCHYYDRKNKMMKYGWRWKGVTKSSGVRRPLYGLDLLLDANRKYDWVLVVEGEKAADAGNSLFDDFITVTWSGGTKSIANTDWSPLSRRNVIVFCDNDEPGHSANIEIFRTLKLNNPNRKVFIVCAPASKEKSWDIGDIDISHKSAAALKSYIKNNAFDYLEEGVDL